MNNKAFSKLYAFISLHILWYFLSFMLGNVLIPPPHTVYQFLFSSIIRGQLLFHLLYSTLRIGSAILLSLLFGVPIGLLIGLNQASDKVLSPLLYILYPIPKIAFLPVFMVLFGLGDFSKVILLFSVLLFQIILATRDSVKQIPLELHHVTITLHLSIKKKFVHLYLPHALPYIFSALRISIGISMAVLFFGENYATTYGIGYYIMNNWIMVNYIGMSAGIVALGLLAAFLIFCIDLVESTLCPWLTYETHSKL